MSGYTEQTTKKDDYASDTRSYFKKSKWKRGTRTAFRQRDRF